MPWSVLVTVAVLPAAGLTSAFTGLTGFSGSVFLLCVLSLAAVFSFLGYSAYLVNASNIYLERGLTIALVIFIVLFAALAAFAVTLLLLPEFRKKVFGNKLLNANLRDSDIELFKSNTPAFLPSTITCAEP